METITATDSGVSSSTPVYSGVITVSATDLGVTNNTAAYSGEEAGGAVESSLAPI